LASTALESADRAAALSSAPAAVAVRGVSKTFRLPHQQYNTLKERALHPFAVRTHEELHALRGVDFEVRCGEFFGIVGRNGSGKSTLLKCLAGIYSIDEGEIDVRGRLSPFIELGVGFNPELTARDNVIINAIMLGLSRGEARARFDAIIDFAELEEFVDLKLKNYSSGMSVRLGFAVSVQLDADTILVDEVLAVGDASFQRKCFDQFDRMKAEGRTILFVTHDMGSVERFCDRGLVLEKGEIVDIGPPSEITRTYGELNFGNPADDPGRAGPARITTAWCETPNRELIATSEQGEDIVAAFEVQFEERLDDPAFTVIFRNDVGHTIFTAASELWAGQLGPFEPGERVVVRVCFTNRLAPSRYTLTPCVGPRGGGAKQYDVYARRDDLAALAVEGPVTGAVLNVPLKVEVERV
jgi:ABC-type polysaccharide/polyol phosphate transport system ATPase subunit